MTGYTIHIGDQAYSSWSLRGWLMLAAFDLPFETRLHRMYDPAMDRFKQAEAPGRTLPLLSWEEAGQTRRVWDSMAIAETLAERHPEAGHWPADAEARAAARCLSAEMHSSFMALRGAAPMNIHRDGRALPVSEGVAADLTRLESLWQWARGKWGAGGPYLFGQHFTVADAFFAPVAWRITGYNLPVGAAAAAYVAALQAHPAMLTWRDAARADTRRLAHYDAV